MLLSSHKFFLIKVPQKPFSHLKGRVWPLMIFLVWGCFCPREKGTSVLHLDPCLHKP